VCYCNDIISSLIQHYTIIGMAKKYDAPSFVRFSDSVGHVGYPASDEEGFNFTNQTHLRSGDSIRFEVEVDSHYTPDDYRVEWRIYLSNDSNDTGVGTSFNLTLQPHHVNMGFTLLVYLISNKNWHRLGKWDATLTIVYTVLPPI
jgi:hypothetical protein